MSRPQWWVGLGARLGVGHLYEIIRIGELIKYVRLISHLVKYVRIAMRSGWKWQWVLCSNASSTVEWLDSLKEAAHMIHSFYNGQHWSCCRFKFLNLNVMVPLKKYTIMQETWIFYTRARTSNGSESHTVGI